MARHEEYFSGPDSVVSTKNNFTDGETRGRGVAKSFSLFRETQDETEAGSRQELHPEAEA